MSSPTGYSLQIIELDPTDASVLSQTDTQIPITSRQSAAFDGTHLVVTDNGVDKIFVVALDGTLINEAPLPQIGSSGPFVTARGPVVIDGTIYLLTFDGARGNQLLRFDLSSLEYYGAMPLSALTTQPNTVVTLPSLSESLSLSPDGQSILATSSSDDQVFSIDPLTARITEVLNAPRTSRFIAQSASLGGRWYSLASNTFGTLDVYDDQFNLIESLNIGISFGLGGGSYDDTGTVVTVTANSDMNYDSGQRITSTSIGGFVSRDANRDGHRQ